jgi:uncharacterized membrane protein YgcG
VSGCFGAAGCAEFTYTCFSRVPSNRSACICPEAALANHRVFTGELIQVWGCVSIPPPPACSQVWTTNRMHAALPENCLCMCAPVGRVAARRLFEQGIVSDGGSPCPHCPQHDSFDKVLRFGRNFGGGGGGGGAGGGGGGTSRSWSAAPDPALVV